MPKNLSLEQALDGVVEADDIPGLVNLVMQHKNWGAFACRVPSYVIVRLIDTVRLLREHGAEYYVTSAGRPSSLDEDGNEVELTDEELTPDPDESLDI
jgi:hypothetical protein